jgi:hypothetical protein
MMDNFTIQGWRVQTGDAVKLVLNFAPAAPMPEAPYKFGFGGSYSTGPGFPTPAAPPACDQIKVTALRKTGPRKMISPGGGLGPEPMEPLSPSVSCRRVPGLGGQLYAMSGLSPIFPNQIDLQVVGNCRGGRLLDRGLQAEIKKTGGIWTTSARFLPQDLVSPVAMQAQFVATPCGTAVARFDPSKYPELQYDSRINWPDQRTRDRARDLTQMDRIIDRRRGRVTQPGEDVAINPQPLPPRETRIDQVLGRGGDVAINPQPLPPRELEMRTQSGDPGKESFCQAYADDAVAMAEEGVRTCALPSAGRYTLYREDHYRWCIANPRTFADSERTIRTREIQSCRRCRTYAANTVQQFTRSQACRQQVGGPFWRPNTFEVHFNWCFATMPSGERAANNDFEDHSRIREKDLENCMYRGLQ